MKAIYSSLLILILSGIYAQNISVHEICSLPSTLNESSGLCLDLNGNIWILNDGGNSPQIHQINTNGDIIRSIQIQNAYNIDWEALTTDRNGHFFIGDFGNNENMRQNLKILKIPDPSMISQNSINAEFIFSLTKTKPPTLLRLIAKTLMQKPLYTTKTNFIFLQKTEQTLLADTHTFTNCRILQEIIPP